MVTLFFYQLYFPHIGGHLANPIENGREYRYTREIRGRSAQTEITSSLHQADDAKQKLPISSAISKNAISN
jgi:hypothetical protein